MYEANTGSLFNGDVRLCYSQFFADYAKDNQTGFLEIDNFSSSNLNEMNTLLEGYKHIITPAPKPKWSDFITGADLRWKRL